MLIRFMVSAVDAKRLLAYDKITNFDFSTLEKNAQKRLLYLYFAPLFDVSKVMYFMMCDLPRF